MADIKQLLRRNRFALEILGLVVAAEFAVLGLLHLVMPPGKVPHASLLQAISLVLLATPLIVWRSRIVHSRETQSLSNALQSSSYAVLLLDKQGCIYWVNVGFTRISGYTLPECLGTTPEALLGSGLTSAQTMEQLRNSRTRAEPCRVEVCNRRKDGTLYWGDIDLRPDFDQRGRLMGFIEICSDITALKQSQRQLKASLLQVEALRHTIDTHAIVSVTDRAGRITEVNAAFCAISGYTREQLLGSNHRLLNSGTHAPQFWTAMWGDIAQGKPWRGEICNRNRSGELYWVDSMIAPFLGADGQIEKYVSIRMDITARKRLEWEREQQSRLLADVLDSLPIGAVVFDESRSMRLHNLRYAQVLRLPPELLARPALRFADLLQHSFARGDKVPGQSHGAVRANWDHAWTARQPVQMEIRQWDASYIDMRALPIADGWMVLSYVDVTERKTQELLLSEVQERVRLATESAGIGIWSHNPITGQQSWDAQQYRLFGLTAVGDKAGPFYDLWRSHLHPQDAAAAVAEFERSLTAGVPLACQYRIVRPDGAVRHIKALGSPRLDAKGQVEYIVGTNQDVTDAVLLAQSLQEARLRAEEASRVKSQFLANMSHEIRTPMHAVTGLLQLLEYAVTDARQHDFVTQAADASRVMLRMIDSVLDHASLQADGLVLRPEAFCVDEWLDELAMVLGASVGDKDLNVLLDLPPVLPQYLVGDSQRLRQVLVCLLDNAIKFTPSGEVICSIALVQQTASACRLDFCVRDTGIGIAPEFLQTMFDDFVQLQSASTRAYGGLGLGLPVSQRLVHLMGGTLAVQSAPDQGSRFCFTLDLAVPDPPPTAPERPQPPPLPQTQALVVDACASARHLITNMAAAMLGHADAAATCEQALALVKSRLDQGGPVHGLILLDWNMPDADSWQTLQQLRTLFDARRCAQPQVILLCNNSNPAQQTRLVDRQGLSDGFLAKPFTPGMLRKVLHAAHAAQHAPYVAPLRLPRLQGLRVLVVEDSPINQRVIHEMLNSEGASVSLAANGQEGVDAVRAALSQQGLDVVLMDLQMPVMDGYQAAREIRLGLGLADLPIIAVSANAQASDRAQCLAAGMNLHMGKPYVLDELVAHLLRLSGRAAHVPTSAAPLAVTNALPVAVPQAQPRQSAALPLLQVYWIGAAGAQTVPDAPALQPQGVRLQLLDSVDALSAGLADAAGRAALVLADRATATSAAMRDVRANGASMKAFALVVLADAVTEDDLHAFLRAGAVDVVSPAYARDHLGVIARNHLNPEGTLRVDPNNPVVAIDGHGAIAHMQADPPFFGSLLRSFFDELPLRQALLHRDWGLDPAQVKHRCHALKGLAVTLGFARLGQLARQAEALQPQAGAALDAGLLVQLEGEMQSARFHILRWLSMHQLLDTPQP